MGRRDRRENGDRAARFRRDDLVIALASEVPVLALDGVSSPVGAGGGIESATGIMSDDTAARWLQDVE